MEHSWGARVLSAAVTVLIVCVLVRVASELIEPLLPSLLVLAGLLFIMSVMFRGPHYRK